ncbi:MAG: hypothetical protein RO009_02175 [Pseudorhodoplanes sp.]|nr:hypothetical protein [Pseudorhodoplanes sp.]
MTGPVSKFKGAELKLQRAKHHIEDFVTQAEALYNREGRRLSTHDDAHTRQRTLIAKINTAVPDHFPLIIGDAVHNLRSALDHMTWDILRPHGPVPDKVQFPFCKRAEGFESVLTNRQIKVAGEEIAQKFRDLKPYPGGNDILYGLHVLDVTDKHELIVPVWSRLAIDRLDISDVDPSVTNFIIENTAFDLLKDNRIAIWRYDPAVPWRDPVNPKQIDVAIHILFRKDQPFGGRFVPTVLREMAVEVERILGVFSN